MTAKIDVFDTCRHEMTFTIFQLETSHFLWSKKFSEAKVFFSKETGWYPYDLCRHCVTKTFGKKFDNLLVHTKKIQSSKYSSFGNTIFS